jgi:hypothetical protein
MKTPLQMFQWIKENSINKRRAEKMDEAELEGKSLLVNSLIIHMLN